ncbi:MAG: PhnD/SsuA/transferrin family substrate-binding protein [Alphaproteobacteria bacterium]|nr:PhnD/SsuA/transferrin family substrate-binding protein [Alphaproteobacteria bacterium]
MRTLRASILGLAAAGLLFGAAGASAEPLKIRIGWVVTPAQLTPFLFSRKEILKHYGKSYTVDPIRFRGSAPQITALAANELDIAAFAYSAFALAIQNAKMTDLKAIADVFQDGVGSHYSIEYLVRNDSPIRTIQDLKGKRLATNGIGGAIDMAMRKHLRANGMEDKRDYSVTEIRFPNMNAALHEKKVDMVGVLIPFAPGIKAKGARPLFTMKDAMGPSQMIFWAARDPFLKKNRAALTDFFEDHQRALRWFTDPKNRAEALQIIADFTKRPVKSYESWVFTGKDFYRDPTGRVNVEALTSNVKVQRDLGFLKIDIDVPAHVDNSFVEEAAKRLN